MGGRPTRAGMKMSYDAAVTPERAKVATVNGTLEPSSDRFEYRRFRTAL